MAARRPRVLTLSAKESVILQLLVRHDQAYGLELVSASRGRLKRGTVYVTLGRMEEKGYITSRLEDAPPEAGGLPRRIYTPNRARAAGAGGLVAAHEVSDPGGDAMSAPNGRLRRFLSAPLLRSHHGAAGRSDSDGYRDRGESRSFRGQQWTGRWIRAAGTFALLKALHLLRLDTVLVDSGVAGREDRAVRSLDLAYCLRRHARWRSAVDAAARCPSFPPSRYQELALYLVPQALPIALPVGLLLDCSTAFSASVASLRSRIAGHGRRDPCSIAVLRRT